MRLRLIYFLFASGFLLTGCSDSDDESITEPVINYTELNNEVSGFLSLENSPYLASSVISVPEGSELDIEAGVDFFFTDSSAFFVYGSLTAVGSIGSRITFQAEDEYWNGIHFRNSTSAMKFCDFSNISITGSDSLEYGGLDVQNGDLIFWNCQFIENSSVHGGGLSVRSANIELFNCIFLDNTALAVGGAVYLESVTGILMNNTMTGNTSINYGGGIVINGSNYVQIYSNIFYNNSGQMNFPGISSLIEDPGTVDEEYNYSAFGSMDPKFVSETNFKLSTNSPCIDAGIPDEIWNDTDGSRNDQGAYGGPLGNW